MFDYLDSAVSQIRYDIKFILCYNKVKKKMERVNNNLKCLKVCQFLI